MSRTISGGCAVFPLCFIPFFVFSFSRPLRGDDREGVRACCRNKLRTGAKTLRVVANVHRHTWCVCVTYDTGTMLDRETTRSLSVEQRMNVPMRRSVGIVSRRTIPVVKITKPREELSSLNTRTNYFINIIRRRERLSLTNTRKLIPEIRGKIYLRVYT